MATFDHYAVTSTSSGGAAIRAGSSLIIPLDDFARTLEQSAQNRLVVRTTPPHDLVGVPTFFSESRITPFVRSVTVELMFSDYSEIPDVEVYIRHYEFAEAGNPDLALKPLSSDFLKVARTMPPRCGCWFLVSVPSSQPEHVAAVLLGERDRASVFRARIYAPAPFDTAPGLVLKRKIYLADEPNVCVSRDMLRLC